MGFRSIHFGGAYRQRTGHPPTAASGHPRQWDKPSSTSCACGRTARRERVDVARPSETASRRYPPSPTGARAEVPSGRARRGGEFRGTLGRPSHSAQGTDQGSVSPLHAGRCRTYPRPLPRRVGWAVHLCTCATVDLQRFLGVERTAVTRLHSYATPRVAARGARPNARAAWASVSESPASAVRAQVRGTGRRSSNRKPPDRAALSVLQLAVVSRIRGRGAPHTADHRKSASESVVRDR